MSRRDRQGSRRRILAALSAAAVAGLIISSAAQAGDETGFDLGTEGGLNYRVNIAEDFNGPAFSSFVACLDGARPISGGIDLEGSSTDGRMGSSHPANEGDLRLWRSHGFNLGIGTIDMSFFAVCREIQPKVLKFRSASRSFDPDQRRTVRAPCPDGFRVIGGGVQSANPIVSANAPYDGRDADKRPDDGWKATAKNTHMQPDQLTAFASCRKAGTWDLKYVKDQVEVPGGGSSQTSTEVCEDGVVTGGGASISGTSGLVRLHETYPVDFNDPDNETPADGWTTSLRNADAGAAPGVFRAICKT